MKLAPGLWLCDIVLLPHPSPAAAEDRALRGRNLSAACSGYTTGPVPAGIPPKRKIQYLKTQTQPLAPGRTRHGKENLSLQQNKQNKKYLDSAVHIFG